jgi:hypothetical protein
VTTLSVSAPATPTAAPAGSAVRDGKFEFQVLNNFSAKTVSDPTGNPYMTATAQRIFLVIVVKVTNVGTVYGPPPNIHSTTPNGPATVRISTQGS